MLAEALGALGSIFSGGLTGLVGSAISAYREHKEQQAEFRHQEKMAELDMAAMEKEAELDMRRQEVATRGEIAVADAEAQAEMTARSFEHDRRRYAPGGLSGAQLWMMVIVDFARGMIRPSVTIYMVVLVTWIYVEMLGLIGTLDQAIDAARAAGILEHIINSVLYVATTVILWWFGTRRSKPSRGGK